MSEAPEGLHVDERRLAAILAADVAGYSRLMGRNEEETVRDLEAHQAVILPLIAKYGGAVINIAGDGIVAQFPSAVRAVECAVAIQKSMVERNFDVPADRRMLLRIGVNLGDIIHDGTRAYGDGINVAARLEPLAEPGGICISANVRDAIFGKLGLPLRDIGEKSLKNIDRPVHIYQIQSSERAHAAIGWAGVSANIAGSRPLSGSSFSSPPPRASARGASGRARRRSPTTCRPSPCFRSLAEEIPSRVISRGASRVRCRPISRHPPSCTRSQSPNRRRSSLPESWRNNPGPPMPSMATWRRSAKRPASPSA